MNLQSVEIFLMRNPASLKLDLARARLMENALKKLPKCTETVYRFEHIWQDKEAFLSFYKEQTAKKMDAFTSTTTKAESLKFKSTPDVSSIIEPSISAADISKLASDSTQEEVLFRAGAYFKVMEFRDLNEDNSDPKANYKIRLQEQPTNKPLGLDNN